MTFLNIMLHLGTLFSVVFVYRKELLALFRTPKELLLLALATLPAGLVGLFLGDAVDGLFAGPYGVPLLSVCFMVTGALLLLCEFMPKRGNPIGRKSAAAMGLMQAVAVLPGISRSGSTIAAGTLAGGDTEEVTKFSFLMSIPIILGSVLLGAVKVGREPELLEVGGVGVVGIAVGVVAAAVSGFFAIKLMRKLMKRANYKWFSAYLFGLSLVTLWLNAIGIL